MRKRTLLLVIAVLAADRLTKLAAARLPGAVTLVPGLLGLRFTGNTGAAFSMLSGNPRLLGLFSLAVILAGLLAYRRLRPGGLKETAAGLMLGGAAGNMFDRLFAGAVPDMIEVLAFRFAVFNLADVFLVIGCVLMAVSLLLRPDEWRRR